jgi:hypothetical protein
MNESLWLIYGVLVADAFKVDLSQPDTDENFPKSTILDKVIFSQYFFIKVVIGSSLSWAIGALWS